MSDETATVSEAPAPAPVAPSASPASLDTVGAAVAELERRSQARKAEKAEQSEAIAAKRQAAAEEMQRMEDEREGRAQPRADESDEYEESDDEQPDADETRDSEDDTPDDDAQEGPAEQEDDKPAVKTVRIGSEEIEIPAGTPRQIVEKVQALAGNLLADYTRKTQEIAAAKTAAQQRAQQAEEVLQRTVQAQKAILQVAQQVIGEPPPISLAQVDPGAYLAQKALYDQRLAQLQAVANHGRGLTEAQQRAQEQAQAEALQEEARKMVEKIPELEKPEARRVFLDRAVQAASVSGFTAEDVAGVSDHRMLHLLHRLMAAEAKVSALDRAGKSTKERLANVPPKVMKPGVSTTPDQQRADRTKKAKSEFMRGDRSMQSVRRLIESGAL